MKEIFGSILFLVLVGAVIWGGTWWNAASEQKKDTRPSISNLANDSAVAVAENKNVPTQDVAAEETKDVPQNTIAQPETAKEKLDIKVVNGGAVKGTAGKVQTFLKTAGYTAVQVGNSVGDYVGATVYYLEGNKGNAEAVKQALLKDYPQIQTKPASSPKAEEGTAAVVVMLGK